MVKRIVQQTVIVKRDGKRVEPKIGSAFDFTDAEVKDFEARAPLALRKPVNEGGDERGEPSPAPTAAKVETGDGDEAAASLGDTADESAAPAPKKTKAKSSKTDDDEL